MDNGWISNMTKIAINAWEASSPCDVCYGAVISPAPQIQIDPKTVLGESQLVLTRNVKDYSTPMTIPGIGRVAVTVHNGLTRR